MTKININKVKIVPKEVSINMNTIIVDVRNRTIECFTPYGEEDRKVQVKRGDIVIEYDDTCSASYEVK